MRPGRFPAKVRVVAELLQRHGPGEADSSEGSLYRGNREADLRIRASQFSVTASSLRDRLPGELPNTVPKHLKTLRSVPIQFDMGNYLLSPLAFNSPHLGIPQFLQFR